MAETVIKSGSSFNQADVTANKELKVLATGIANQVSTSASVTRVSSSATNVTLIAPNASRLGAILFNESTQICYVKLGLTASSTSYTQQMAPNSTFIIDQSPDYTGQIDAIWAAANGAMQVTELLP